MDITKQPPPPPNHELIPPGRGMLSSTSGGGRLSVQPSSHMARSTKIYKLYTVAAAGAAMANIQIPRAGLIVSVNWSINGLSGAGTDTGLVYELTLNQASSQLAVNDTPGTVIDSASATNNVASSAFSTNRTTMFPGIPVAEGDRLYINGNQQGATAPGTVRLLVHVAIVH